MRKAVEAVNGCWARAHAEEMLFVLMARDVAAPATIRFWVDERIRLGKNVHSDAQIVEALRCADTMEREGPPRVDEVICPNSRGEMVLKAKLTKLPKRDVRR